MKITDEMVEMGGKAVASAYQERYGAFLGATAVKDIARAALEAALGDVEPLESVLVALGGAMITVHLLPPQNGHDTRVAVAVKPNDRRRRETHGTGPTIDAAIRAAVANATT